MPETITLSMDDMLKRFEYLAAKLPEAIYPAVILSSEAMVADVVKNRMSGQYLGVVTGTARRSMQGFGRISSDSAAAVVGSPLKYVKAHEDGFSGVVMVKAHTSQHRHGRALSVDIKTRRVSKWAKVTKKQKARGSWMVKAHPMHMHLRARHFIRDTVRAAVEPTMDRIQKAIYVLARTGRPPSRSELGA